MFILKSIRSFIKSHKYYSIALLVILVIAVSSVDFINTYHVRQVAALQTAEHSKELQKISYAAAQKASKDSTLQAATQQSPQTSDTKPKALIPASPAANTNTVPVKNNVAASPKQPSIAQSPVVSATSTSPSTNATTPTLVPNQTTTPSVQPNYAIHVTKTGDKSIAWTSNYSANGYYLIFQTIGDCRNTAVVIPCTAYLTAPGTTSGSYTFTYGVAGQTYGATVLVSVCVNEDIANCGTASDNYVYLNF